MTFDRLLLLIRRSMIAASQGVRFTGTSQFQLPRRVRLCGRVIPIAAPPEGGLAFDYLNIWLDDEYGLKALPFTPAKIIDVGSNIGLFSLWALRNFPDAQIHGYEPNPNAAKFAESNLAGFNSVTLFPEAVGSKSGSARLIQANSGESRMVLAAAAADSGVPMIAFSEAVARMGGNIDLLKLDCEGAEWEIFRNPAPFREVRVVRMEYHLTEGQRIDDLRQAAGALGFEIDRLIENDGFGIAWWKRR